MAAFIQFYQASFNARPYTTLLWANASLNALGDIVAQTTQLARRDRDTIRTRVHHYDFARTARFTVFGAAMGPIIGKWIKFLEYQFPLRQGGGKAKFIGVAKRVVSDQIAMAPVGVFAFIGAMGLMERRTGAEIRQKYIDLYLPALLTNWTVWPFVQMVNFRFMPLAFRVPFQAGCGVFWTVYLSLLNSSENERRKERIAVS